ncbi:MAG: ABC transporter ATP-binding protein [Tahibacter sp.]
MTAPTLDVESVSYRYRRGRVAVADLSLSLRPGILGLLGPNGAGKSTLMRMFATLTRPSQGRILWRGTDIARSPDALRRELGYLPQDFGVYAALSAREFLAYLAAVKSLPSARIALRVEECLALVGLADAADRRLADFSGGMRQRVGIAQALLNDPKLLVVDEPTVGLDPEERLRFRHLLTDLAGDRLVVLSTHIVSDIEASATGLAIMAGGRLHFDGTPDALLAAAAGHVWTWTVAPERLAEIRAQFHISSSLRKADGVLLRVVGATPPSVDAEPARADLEDAYLWLLNRGAA